MKYNINNLYFAKCRHYIMDIVNVTDSNGNVMTPHPDYVDYYTILLLKDNKYVNIHNRGIKYKDISEIDNDQEHYDEDLIIEICSLTNFIDTEHKRISTKECELIDDTIQKTKSLKIKYGYKTVNNK